jgi:hypothetical protein
MKIQANNGKKDSQSEDVEVPDMKTVNRLGVLAEKRLKELVAMSTPAERTAVSKLLAD